MTIAHIRNGAVIKRFGAEIGWITLEDGRKTSPPVVGFVDGNDKVVVVVDEVQDTSTGGQTVKTVGEWQVEADRVYRLTTIRDKTQEEIDAQIEANKDAASESLDISPELKALATAIYLMGKGNTSPQVFTNPTNFKTWLRSLM